MRGREGKEKPAAEPRHVTERPNHFRSLGASTVTRDPSILISGKTKNVNTATFSNKLLVEEVPVFCPLWHHCVLGASGHKNNDTEVFGPKTNLAALVSSIVACV